MRFSLFSQGVRHKFLVAASLMATIPLLVLLYLVVTYILPHADFTWSIVAIVALCAVIAGLGTLVARDLILPITTIAKGARQLADGQRLEQELPADREDELGDLSAAMNRLNERIRNHMTQLRDYGEQVRELNTEVHQRVLALSNLLQVGHLISQGVSLQEVFDCVIEKLSQIEAADLYALLIPSDDGTLAFQVVHGTDPRRTALLKGTAVVSAWLTRVLRESQQPVAVDARHRAPAEVQELEQVFNLTNALAVPVTSRGRGIAVVLLGNRRPDFTFSDEVFETSRIFAKQVAIAMEKDALTRRASALTMTDELTGLYNERYLRTRLEEEVKRAGLFHHPCSLLLVGLDGFDRIQREYGLLAAEGCLKQAADLFLKAVGPVDKVARLQDAAFGLLFPERTKREALELAETLRRAVAAAFASGRDASAYALTMSGGVSENPLDGAIAEELWQKAEAALSLAKRQGRNRIIASEPQGA